VEIYSKVCYKDDNQWQEWIKNTIQYLWMEATIPYCISTKSTPSNISKVTDSILNKSDNVTDQGNNYGDKQCAIQPISKMW